MAYCEMERIVRDYASGTGRSTLQPIEAPGGGIAFFRRRPSGRLHCAIRGNDERNKSAVSKTFHRRLEAVS